MRYPASEKLEIIRLVENSHLSARRTLQKLGIPRSTFNRWYDRFLAGGVNALVENVDRGVSEVRRVIASLSHADLTQEMAGHFEGDFAELQANVNGAMLTLRSTMTGILSTAGTITGNSRDTIFRQTAFVGQGGRSGHY